jgi:nicotinate phosphoribosyltransferase
LANNKKNHNLNIVQKDTWPVDLRPNPSQLAMVTDTYFLRTKNIVASYGDTEVTYAIFMRRPVISALNPAIDWLSQIIKERKGCVNIKRCFAEGSDVGAGEPLLYISGSFFIIS